MGPHYAPKWLELQSPSNRQSSSSKYSVVTEVRVLELSSVDPDEVPVVQGSAAPVGQELAVQHHQRMAFGAGQVGLKTDHALKSK